MDTEFLEDGVTIDPVSIAIITEDHDGPELYLEFDSREWTQEPNDFVKEHVLPHLWSRQESKREFNEWERQPHHVGGLVSRREGRALIAQFIDNCTPADTEPEIWAYYADYDWVLFCRLFGQMVDLPPDWPKWCRDLKQTAWHLGLGVDDFPPHDEKLYGPAHNSLADTRRNRATFETMQAFVKHTPPLWGLRL